MKAERRLPVADGDAPRLPALARRSRAAIDLSGQTEVTLVVRSKGSDEEWRPLVERLTRGLPGERRYLTRAEFARKWAASPEDVEAVRRFAIAQRLKGVSSDPFRRCVGVPGSLRQLSRAFPVEFFAVDHPLGRFRFHRGAPAVPESIQPLIECVLGLDDLPAASPHAAPAAKGGGMNRQALL